jgi:hypothetical protein
MAVFSFIFLLANFAFANAFFLLDGGRTGTIGSEDRITGDNWFETLIYTYLTGLGEFNADDYAGTTHSGFLYLYFILCTILVQIVLLNLLIAIMGDTFDRVQEQRHESQLKEKCRLISENWYWLNQKKTFKRTKYITVANLESADGTNSSSWEGKLANLKNYFTTSLNGVQDSVKTMKQQQKDEMTNL